MWVKTRTRAINLDHVWDLIILKKDYPLGDETHRLVAYYAEYSDRSIDCCDLYSGSEYQCSEVFERLLSSLSNGHKAFIIELRKANAVTTCNADSEFCADSVWCRIRNDYSGLDKRTL